MERFYNLIEIVRSLKHTCEEDSKMFRLCFNYHEKLDTIIEYNSLHEIKTMFPKCLNLYISLNSTNEIDIFDFLNDKQEFEDEIESLKTNKVKYTLIFNKDKFVKNRFTNLINCKFIDYLSQAISVLESKVFNENKKNVFILGKSNTFFNNDFIMVTNIRRENLDNELNIFNNSTIIVNMRKNIIKRNELCNWVDGSHFLGPETLYIDFDNEEFIFDNGLDNIIWRKNIDLIVPFMSNFTGIIDDKYISVVNGNKRIEIYYDLNLKDYNLQAYKNLFKLYKWVYEESTFDKINICRNVMSILVTAKCQGSPYKTIIQNSDWLVKSVQDNFLNFLQKNIESFFNEQNTVINKLTDNITGINNQVSELTKITITNITSFLGTAIAALVGYIVNVGIGYIKILAFLYICFIIINSTFNLPMSIIRAMQYKNDFKLNKKLYLKLYPDDSSITKMDKRNQFNLLLFAIYTFFTIGLVAVIITFIMKTDITQFIAKFK